MSIPFVHLHTIMRLRVALTAANIAASAYHFVRHSKNRRLLNATSASQAVSFFQKFRMRDDFFFFYPSEILYFSHLNE